MKESLQLSTFLNTPPQVLYKAWLNSELHSEMTGGEAHCSNVVGGFFSVWDGYISGKNVELTQGTKIVQSWRTTEFDETEEDSVLTLEFIPHDDGTLLNLSHINIPKGQTQYEKGWVEHYFNPMKVFFASN